LLAHARQNNFLVAHLKKEGSHARRTYRAHLPLPSPPPSTTRSSRWPLGRPPQMKQQQSPLSRRSPPPPLMLRTSFYSFFPQAHLFPLPLHHDAIAKTAEAARRSRRVSGDQDKEDPRQRRARRSRRRKRKKDPVPVFSHARIPPVAAAAFPPSLVTVRDLTPQVMRAMRTGGRLASVQGSRARAASHARRRAQEAARAQ
jgi:hypothetical protein